MRSVDDDFQLLDSDKLSATWKRIERHLQERLDLLRRKNDGNLSPDQTAYLRGQIAETKRLLALGDDPLAPVGLDDGE